MISLAFCYINKMRRNTVICITGIAVSIMMLFSLVQIGELILSNYKNLILATAPFDFVVQGLDKNTADEIHEKYESRYRMTQAIFFAQSVENEAIYHEVLGVKGDWMTIFQVELLDGNEPVGSHEICLEKSYAKEKALQVGDALSLPLRIGSSEEKPVEFVISGILSDTPSYSAGTYMFLSADEAESILLDVNRDQFWEEATYTEYVLMNRDGFPDEEDRFQFGSYIFNTFGSEIYKNIDWTANEKKSELENNQGMYRLISSLIWVIVAFIAVVMTIFIYYMMEISFQSKLDQYGTMRALGSSNARLGRMIISELFLYGCGGMVLGCLAGFLFNKIFAQMIIKIFVGDQIDQLQTSLRMVLYVAGIVSVSMFTVYLRIMLRIVRKKPIELIHNIDHVVKKRFFTCKSDIAEMVINNSFRNKRSSRALLLTMTLTFLAVLLLGNGLGSISFDLKNTMFAFADLEVTVMPGVDATLGQVQIAKEDLEVLQQYADEIYCQGWEVEYHAYDENGEPLAQVWVYSQNLMEKLIRMQNLNPETRVVFTCEDAQKMRGNQIVLRNSDENSILITIDETIGANWTNLAGQMASGPILVIIGEEYAEELFDRAPRWMDVYLSGNDLTRDDVRGLLPSDKYVVYDFVNIMGEAVTQLQMLLILLAYMMVSLIGLVIFMITSIVKQNFEHRKKEIGMMRAIGADRKRMEIMLCGEVFVLVFLACIIASLLAIPISIYVYNIINEEAGMAVIGYLIGLPVTLLLSGIVICGNVRKCLKQKTMELLKSEG